MCARVAVSRTVEQAVLQLTGQRLLTPVTAVDWQRISPSYCSGQAADFLSGFCSELAADFLSGFCSRLTKTYFLLLQSIGKDFLPVIAVSWQRLSSCYCSQLAKPFFLSLRLVGKRFLPVTAVNWQTLSSCYCSQLANTFFLLLQSFGNYFSCYCG